MKDIADLLAAIKTDTEIESYVPQLRRTLFGSPDARPDIPPKLLWDVVTNTLRERYYRVGRDADKIDVDDTFHRIAYAFGGPVHPLQRAWKQDDHTPSVSNDNVPAPSWSPVGATLSSYIDRKAKEYGKHFLPTSPNIDSKNVPPKSGFTVPSELKFTVPKELADRPDVERIIRDLEQRETEQGLDPGEAMAFPMALLGKDRGTEFGGKVKNIPPDAHIRPEYVSAIETHMGMEAFCRSTGGRAILITDAHRDTMRHLGFPEDAQPANEEDQKTYAKAVSQALREITAPVLYGETYYITKDIMALLEDAAHDLPRDAVFLPSLLPSPAGLVILPSTWTSREDAKLHGGTSKLRPIIVFGWAPDRPLIDADTNDLWYRRYRFWAYAASPIRERAINGVVTRDNVRLTVEGVAHAWEPVGSAIVDPGQLLSMTPDGIIDAYADNIQPEYEKQLLEGAGFHSDMLRWFGSLLFFMAQELAVRSTHRAPRALRRRATVRKDDTVKEHVHVILLRRKNYAEALAAGDHVPTPVNWSHRWLVRAHWRNQNYPSLGKTMPKYIRAFIKGPDNLPYRPPGHDIYGVTR